MELRNKALKKFCFPGNLKGWAVFLNNGEVLNLPKLSLAKKDVEERH